MRPEPRGKNGRRKIITQFQPNAHSPSPEAAISDLFHKYRQQNPTEPINQGRGDHISGRAMAFSSGRDGTHVEFNHHIDTPHLRNLGDGIKIIPSLLL